MQVFQSLDKFDVLSKSHFESVCPWYTVQEWLVWYLFVNLHLNFISVFLWFHFIQCWEQEFELPLEWIFMTLQVCKLCLVLHSCDLCLDSFLYHVLILLSQLWSVLLDAIVKHFPPHVNFCFGLCKVLLRICRLSTTILLLKRFLLNQSLLLLWICEALSLWRLCQWCLLCI